MTTALGMRVKLARLKQAHNITTVAPVTITPTQPTSHAQILTGYASTLDIDLTRQKFRPYAFGNIRLKDPPPLYYKHNIAAGEVGTIQSLTYDDHGALLVRCRVTDPIARRCNAFSVGVTVRDEYEIINADRPDFYALIKYAELTEISLTDTPANIHARVHNRMATCARAEFFGHAASAVDRISQMLALLHTNNRGVDAPVQKGTHPAHAPS